MGNEWNKEQYICITSNCIGDGMLIRSKVMIQIKSTIERFQNVYGDSSCIKQICGRPHLSPMCFNLLKPCILLWILKTMLSSI